MSRKNDIVFPLGSGVQGFSGSKVERRPSGHHSRRSWPTKQALHNLLVTKRLSAYCGEGMIARLLVEGKSCTVYKLFRLLLSGGR